MKSKRRAGSRQKRKTKATEGKLLDAARSAFAERGLDLTTVDEITERADVGKGTFYYHFETREKLVEELIDRVGGELCAAIRDRCREESSLEGMLDALVETHISFFSNRWENFVLHFQGRIHLTLDDTYAGIEKPYLDYLELIESMLARVAQRHLPKPVLTNVACAVAGFISGYYSFALIASEPEEIGASIASLRPAMVAGLVRFIRETEPKAADRPQP